MRFRFIYFAALLLIGVQPAYCVVQGHVGSLEGSDWKSFSESNKVAYALGFMEAATELSHYLTLPMPASGPARDCAADHPADFNGIGVGQMTDGMDEFYKNYRNQRIHLALAMIYVKDTITGCNTETLKKELDFLRNNAVTEDR